MSKDNTQQYPFFSNSIYEAVNEVLKTNNNLGRHITRKEATEASKKLIILWRKELDKNDRVLFPQLGTLSKKSTASRKGRNPRTGEEIIIPQRNNIKFTPSSNVKKELK